MSRRRAHATHRRRCDVGGGGGVDCSNCSTDGTRTNDAAGAATDDGDDDHDDGDDDRDDGDGDRCEDGDDGDGHGDARDNENNDDGENDDGDDEFNEDDEFNDDDHRPARAIAKTFFDDAIPAPRRPGHHIVVLSSAIRSWCYDFVFAGVALSFGSFGGS